MVELLVVIGIIAVLIGILLPSLRKARLSAQEAACASNLRQLAIADNSYAADNKGYRVPLSAISPTGVVDTLGGLTGRASYSWQYLQVTQSPNVAYSFEKGLFGPYLKSDKVLECPTMVGHEIAVVAEGMPRTTYAPGSVAAAKLSQITDGTQTVSFADAINLAGNVTTTPITLSRPTQLVNPGNAAGTWDTFHGRHSGGRGNVAFFDGHVAQVRAQTPLQSCYNGILDSRYQMLKANNIGALSPMTINFSATPTNATYKAECVATYNFYFWYSKKLKK